MTIEDFVGIKNMKDKKEIKHFVHSEDSVRNDKKQERER